MDASEIKAAAGETGGILKAGQDAGGSSAKEPAQLNVKAASKYLGLLSRDRAQVSDGLQRALNSVHSTLNSYIQDPQRIRSAAQASSLEGEGEFSRLSSRVISRDASLSESVAEDLSTKSHLVRSRDASAEFEKTMGDLPPALKEDTAAGAALSKAIAQSLLNLTDHQTLGAGLERDLAVRGVYVPEQELSQRSRDATSRVLQVSLAFAKSNSPEELKELPAEPEPAKEAPGSTTPQIMTRYLRQALDEFPDDSTYLDIFRKNKEAGAPQPDDKVSIETAERIHYLIAKAAETARRGNLIPGGNSQSAAAESISGPSATTFRNEPTNTSTAAAPDGGDARELSLSELSERASRLQRQFRLERQKLASEGQMPDPAEYPPSKAVPAGKPSTAGAATAEAPNADAARIAEPVSAKQATEPPTSKAAPESKEAAGASAKAAEAAPADATAKAKQAPSTLSLEDASVSVSYKAVQNPFYGGISSVPGMTLPVNGFDDQAALGFAARSMVQDFSTPRIISRILKEQEALAGGAQSAPKGTAEASLKTASPQVAAASSAQENAQPVLKGEAETAAGNHAKAPAAAGGNADASSVPEEALSTVSENGASKQASAAPASTAAATAEAVSDEALATEETKASSTAQAAKLQSQSVESSSSEETAPEAEAKPADLAEADELEPAASEEAAGNTTAKDAASAELKAASTAPATSESAAPDEAATDDGKAPKAPEESAQAPASSSHSVAPAEDDAAGAIEEASQAAQKAVQSSKPQAAFVAASQPAEAANQAPAATEAEELESEQAAEPPRQGASRGAAEPPAGDDADAATATAKQAPAQSTDEQAIDANAQQRAADAEANEDEDTARQDSRTANAAQSSKPQATFTASASAAKAAAEAAGETPETAQQPYQAATASAVNASEAEASATASEEESAATSPAANAAADDTAEDASTAIQNPAKGTAASISASQQGVSTAVSGEPSAEEPATEEQPASASGKSASAASGTSGSGSAASSLPESTAISSSVQAAAAQAENADESADTSSKSASAAGLKASEAAQSFVAAGMSATAGGASTDDASSEEADADKAGADAGAKSAPSQGSSIGDSIMKGTVPASELDDSDTPEDAPDNDGRNLGREAAGAIDTAKEASGEAEAAKAPADPLKAPAAAAVTTGGSAPVPQESVITTPQGTVKEGGFLRRLASIFSPSKAAANAAAAEAAAAQSAALQLKLGQGSPLDAFASTLASLGASRFLPPEVRKEARDLRAKLMDPVRDLAAVDSWLEFVAAPMSPSSPRAAAMHQWAFFILCLRFRELGKSVDKFLKKLGIGTSADLPIDDMLLSHQDDEGAGEKLCESTLSQLQRLQQLAPQDLEGFFNRAIPLPPAYDGGKEGSLSLRREKKKDGRKIWHLQFAFDLEKLGPVEIRAVASFPEVRLSYVAQTLEGLQALQSKVPELEKQLGDLGLEPRSSSPRIGRVDAMQRRDKASSAAKAPDGMVDVDI